MRLTCVREPTVGLVAVTVDDGATVYHLDPGHFTAEFAEHLECVLASAEQGWVRHGDPSRPGGVAFRLDRSNDLPESVPVTCVDDPGWFAFAVSSAHVTPEGCAALDVAARLELRNWSQV